MPLSIPAGPFAAYLFDCDGTITDSMPLHHLAWQHALGHWGAVFPEELFYAWGGRPIADIVHALNAQQHLNMPVDDVLARKEAWFMEHIADLKGIPDVLAEIHRMHGKIPFAVVSGSPRGSVTRSLEVLGILPLFDTMVCAGDYTHGKPDPEPFLLAASRLNVDPAACLVFEDADLGIESATRAGMASVKVPQPGR